MKPLFLIIAGVLSTQADGQTGPNWPDCYCTDKNKDRFELGETTCLRVDGRAFTAQCQMSQNNPMWREIGESCEIG